MYDERGKEAAELLGVAVDALDHFPRCPPVVERHVELHAVAGQVAAEGVGGGPPHAAAGVGGDYVDGLLKEGNDREQHGDPYEMNDWAATQRLVDEVAKYLGSEELEPDVAQEQDGDRRRESLLGPQIGPEQARVLPEGNTRPGRGCVVHMRQSHNLGRMRNKDRHGAACRLPLRRTPAHVSRPNPGG